MDLHVTLRDQEKVSLPQYEGESLMFRPSITWLQFLGAVSAKLKLPQTIRVYTPQGGELDSLEDILDNDVLYVCREGVPFVPPRTRGSSMPPPRPPRPSRPQRPVRLKSPPRSHTTSSVASNLEGFLYKQGSSRALHGGWKKRYFRTLDNRMSYYSSPEDTKELGFIDLKNVTHISRFTDEHPTSLGEISHKVEHKGRVNSSRDCFGFVLRTKERDYFLRATSPKNLAYWLNGLIHIRLRISAARKAERKAAARAKLKEKNRQLQEFHEEERKLKETVCALQGQLKQQTRAEFVLLLVSLRVGGKLDQLNQNTSEVEDTLNEIHKNERHIEAMHSAIVDTRAEIRTISVDDNSS